MPVQANPGGQRQRPQQMSRQQYVNKRRRRRKAMMLRFFAIFAIAICAVLLVIGAIFLFKGKSYSGTFEREIDVTDRVSADIALWLSDIDDMEIDSGWVKSRVEPYVVKETLTLSDDDVYSAQIDSDSYNALTDKVNADIDTLLTEIIRDKLIEKGYKDEVSDEEAAQITKDVLGMSASMYLQSAGISLVPTINEISEPLEGEFSMHGNKITYSVNGNEKSETIIKKKGTLVFAESGRVYYEKEQNETN